MFFYKNHPDAKTPARNSNDERGFDFYGLGETVIRPGEILTVRTGIVLGFPPGIGGFIWDKSGNASKGLTTLGGVLDWPYVGEIKIVLGNNNLWGIIELLKLNNSNCYDFLGAINECTIIIPKNKGIAQLIFERDEIFRLNEVSEGEFKEIFRDRYRDNVRGEKGFGEMSDRI